MKSIPFLAAARPGWPLYAVALALALAPAVSAQTLFPRLGLPSCIHGNGVPYLDSLGRFDTVTLDAVARFDQVVVDASPICEYHPELVGELRRRNPAMEVFAYVVGSNIWEVNAADSLVHYPTRYNHLVRDLDGFLYDRGGAHYPNMDVNLAKRDLSGRYVVAEAVADLFYDAVVSTGLWDGIFIDVFPDDISWSQTPSESIDVQRAGYASQSAFNTAWYNGTDALANRLRARCGSTFLIVGNGGIGHKYTAFNGWTREDFPNQGGGTWSTNMFRNPGGYLSDELAFRAPLHNQIVSISLGTNPYDPVNTRKVRYALATACFATGFASFEPLDRVYTQPPLEQWWYDEYAVDVVSGQSKSDLGHTHWLGQALGAPYQMIWAGTSTDAVLNPGFETSVSTGWSFGQFAPGSGSIARDATTSAVGASSAHVTVTTTGINPWDVNLTTSSTLMMFPGVQYSATFWAKSSNSRVMSVSATLPTGGQIASGSVTLGPTWQQYQLVLEPFAVGSAELEFFLGLQAGEVWFDDVHLQSGATNIWRRDFENGIVLVNPALTPSSVPLGATFRRILGTRDPVTNNGAAITTAVVNSGDALFLIGAPVDHIPPDPIRDAHVDP